MAENASDAFVAFDHVQKSYDGETLVVKDLNLFIDRGEFLTMLGPSGSGKTTCLMMLAGFETDHPRRDPAGRQVDQQHLAAQARHRDGVPELRAVPAHDGGRKPRLPAGGAQHVQGGSRRQGQARARHGADGRICGPPPGAAFGRPAAAYRAGPRAGVRARACADGRTAGRARQAAARAHAVRDQAHPRTPGRDGRLRHPRPVRGADHVEPCRGLRRRGDPAAGAARCALRKARKRLRRAVHRREQQADGRRGGAGRATS